MTAVAFEEGGFVVDAQLIAASFGLEPAQVPELMRAGAITSVCERGVDEDEGRWRLTFFHANGRLRLVVDSDGTVVRRSAVDFGDRGAARRTPDAP